MTPVTAPQSLVRPAQRPAGENRVLLAAFLVSLVLHVVGMFVMQRVPVDMSGLSSQPKEQTVEIALAKDDPAAAKAVAEAEREEADRLKGTDRQQREWVPIPERLASGTPNPRYSIAPPEDDSEQVKRLAMYHALAANPIEGADGFQPSAPRLGEYEAVDVSREKPSDSPGVSVQAKPGIVASQADAQEQVAAAEAADAQERARILQDRKGSSPVDGGAVGTEPMPRPADQAKDIPEGERQESRPPAVPTWWRGETPSVLGSATGLAVGDRGFDFDQSAQGRKASGVAQVGEFSLNTWEWNFAPWVQAFQNRMHLYWRVPEAFNLGLLSGKTVLRVVVEKDGTVSAVEILETEGHESLHQASRAVFISGSPFMMLPSHFPEERLEIKVTLIYSNQPR